MQEVTRLQRIKGAITRHPVIFGIAVYLISLAVSSLLLAPTTCRDGWHSQSIGRRGACSYHGGVYHSPWPNLVSLLLGAAAGLIAASDGSREQRRADRKEKG